MRDICPACEVEVEYEGSGAGAACGVCGRTRGAALETVAGRHRQRREARMRWIGIGAGAIAFAALLVFRFDSTAGALVSTLTQVVILSAVYGLYQWRRRK